MISNMMLLAISALTLLLLLELLRRVKYTSRYWILVFNVKWEGGASTTIYVVKNKGYPDLALAQQVFQDKLEEVYGMPFTASIIHCDGITRQDTVRVSRSSFYIKALADQADFSSVITK